MSDQNAEDAMPRSTGDEMDPPPGWRVAGSSDDDGAGADPGEQDDPRDEEQAEPARPAEAGPEPGVPDRQAADGRVGELREQLLRTAADFENYRKRTERERIEERKHAAAGIVRDLLPVLDNLHRALEHARSVQAPDGALGGFVEGVGLVHGQLRDVLTAAGLAPIDTSGLFDPMLHEAMMQEATSKAPHMAILDVFEPGWTFAGRLLRPARVKVAVNADGRRAGGEAEDEPPADDPDAIQPADLGGDADAEGERG